MCSNVLPSCSQLKPEALRPQQQDGGSGVGPHTSVTAGPHTAVPHTPTSRMVEEVTAAWPTLAPCTWSADPAYVATMVQRAATWSQEVMSKVGRCVCPLCSWEYR